MLSQEQWNSLAENSGIEADVLAQAISDEQEIKLELPEGRFFTVENEQTLVDNTAKRKYDEGKTKGSKEVFETVKQSFKIEGDSIEDLFSNYKTTVLEEAKIEPNQKLTEKDNAIKALQNSLKLREEEAVVYQSEKEQSKRNAVALSSLPVLRENLGIKKQEALDLILANVEVREGGVYKGGQLQVDSHQSEVSFEDFIKAEVTLRGWVGEKMIGNGGKGTGVSSVKPKSYSEFQKHCESKKWSEAGQQAKVYLKALVADNASFDLEN